MKRKNIIYPQSINVNYNPYEVGIEIDNKIVTSIGTEKISDKKRAKMKRRKHFIYTPQRINRH